jgi:hypothetical protein
MTRETKAQREARVANEKLLHEQECRNSYHQRLMTVLEAASKEGCDITVVDGMFVVYGWNDNFELGLDWDWKNDYTLSDLQFQVDVAKDARAEEQRKADLRINALAKLTQEERELLNL